MRSSAKFYFSELKNSVHDVVMLPSQFKQYIFLSDLFDFPEDKRDAIYITGPSGSGKTELCKEIEAKYTQKVIDLDWVSKYSNNKYVTFMSTINKLVQLVPSIIMIGLSSNWEEISMEIPTIALYTDPVVVGWRGPDRDIRDGRKLVEHSTGRTKDFEYYRTESDKFYSRAIQLGIPLMADYEIMKFIYSLRSDEIDERWRNNE